MKIFTYAARGCSIEEFIDFWCLLYADPEEDILYDKNINEHSKDAVRELFKWKNGGDLSERKKKSIENNFIDKMSVLRSLDPNLPPLDFLRRFPKGGAIFRIFYLHIWQPDKYPIYDQHVHRAMKYILDDFPEAELGKYKDDEKINEYINGYLPFFSTLPVCDYRKVDRALWAFGKFIKSNYSWPIIRCGTKCQ